MTRIDEILKEAEVARKNPPNLETSEAIEITEALYEICRQNGRNDKHVVKIENSLVALRDGNAIQGRSFYSQVPLCGCGAFNDWRPRKSLDLLGNKYNGQTFEVIVQQWSKLMTQIHT